NMFIMRKGELTRQAILGHAAELASKVGLAGLTLGTLADSLHLSKSGLFAHFKSKEQLELQVLEVARERFVAAVVRPSLSTPRGEPRLRAIFENWLRWPELSGMAGGCIFVALAAELDDRPGPARDRLVELQRDWFETIATCARGAITEGHFARSVD